MPSYEFTSKGQLTTAIDQWIDDETAATITYGDINTWDITAITDMNGLFRDKSGINFRFGATEKIKV